MNYTFPAKEGTIILALAVVGVVSIERAFVKGVTRVFCKDAK